MRVMSPLKTALLGVGLLAGFTVIGCTPKPVETASEPPKEIKKDEPVVPDTPLAEKPNDGDDVAVLDTAQGKIVVMFYPDRAPKTVDNFKKLASEKFYDGTRFHRIIPGFMIQGGDPNSKDLAKKDSWGMGGPGYNIDDELNDIKHVAGVLSMAHAGPNTGGSQFFIMDGDAPHLDGVHTGFGKVVAGMDVVKKIIALPEEGSRPVDDKAGVINSITIQKWPVK